MIPPHSLHACLAQTWLWRFFTCLVVASVVQPASAAEPIIVDHNCTRLGSIPTDAITQAKASLHIAYGHTSHGAQLISGMDGLALLKGDLYRTNAGGTNGALDLRDRPFSGASDLGNPNRTAWAASTRTCLSQNPQINVIIWSWCGQAEATTAEIDLYLNEMNQLELEYPQVDFVYMTGHLVGTGLTGTLHLRNEQIRAFCRTNGKTLYDFADIESYNPDGVFFGDRRADDGCNYDGNNDGIRESNWALEWQATHTKGVEWYECSSNHSQPLNANLKAYAAWWLFARLAGWSGSGAETPVTPPQIVPVPAQPRLVSVTNSQINLAWDAVSSAGAYQVLRNGAIIATCSETAYADTGLRSLTSYAYTLRALNQSGLASADSGSLTVSTLADPTPPVDDASQGLVAHWPMNEFGGTILADLSGNQNTGTITCGTTWIGGLSTSALSFDGIDDRVDLGTSTFGLSAEMSVSLWLRPTGPSVVNSMQSILQRGLYLYPFQLRLEGDVLRAGIRLADGRTVYLGTASRLRRDAWQHIAMTFREGRLALFINGLEDAALEVHGALYAAQNQAVVLGIAANGTAAFRGDMDDLRIYNRALGAAEVLGLASLAEAPGSIPAPLDLTAVAASGSQVDLSWQAPASLVSGYNVYRANVLVGRTQQTSFSDTSLSPLTSYSYTVRAFDDQLHESTICGPVGVTTLSGTGQPTVDLHAGLAAHLSFEGEGPSITADLSGQGHDGILVGGVTVTQGLSGQALHFDGIDDHVDLGTSPFGHTSEFSVGLWFKWEGAVGAQYFQTLIQRGRYLHPFLIRMESNTLRAGVRTRTGTQYLYMKGKVVPNEWHHVLITWKSGEFILYLDGLPNARMSTTGELYENPKESTWIGMNPAGSHGFHGCIDDVRVYRQALTEEAAGALFESPLTRHAKVGEELVFNATDFTAAYVSTDRYEWDFGDGSSFKYGAPLGTVMDSGISCTHHYMVPGEYNLSLRVSRLVSETWTPIANHEQLVVVTGEQRKHLFELLHANFHARSALYVYARTQADAVPAGSRLVVKLKGDNGFDRSFCDAVVPADRQLRFLLPFGELPKGNYTLEAQLRSASLVVLDQIVERFAKPYDGVSRTSIDENNALCLEGKPFFPVTPSMLNKEYIPVWSGTYVNCLYDQGYYAPTVGYNVSSWFDYLDAAGRYRVPVIGPARWDGFPTEQYYLGRNANLNKLATYVRASREHPSLFAWMWADEPNMGGRNERVPAQVVRSWTKICHDLDPLRPVATNLYGPDYLPYRINASVPGTNYLGDSYDYMTNSRHFGGAKTLITDILGFDIYSIEFATHVGLTREKATENYAFALDQIIERNFNLAPVITYVEVTDIGEYQNTPPPTPAQINMLAWVNITHGAKGIGWFHYIKGPNSQVDARIPYQTPVENLEAMKTVLRQTSALAPIFLGPPTSIVVTDDANVNGNRVDTLVRETADAIWIFAVRITEEAELGTEPVKVSFALNQTRTAAVEVYDETRAVTLDNGSFSDSFAPCAVHIYRIPKQ